MSTVVISDRERGRRVDVYWYDGYLSDPRKMYEAGKRYAFGATKGNSPPTNLLAGEDLLIPAILWLDDQPAVDVFYESFTRRSVLRGSEAYPAVKREVQRDPNRRHYRVILLVRSEPGGVRYLGPLRGEKRVEELFTGWGLELKRPDQYENFQAFESDVTKLLSAVAALYRGAKAAVGQILDDSFPPGLSRSELTNLTEGQTAFEQ